MIRRLTLANFALREWRGSTCAGARRYDILVYYEQTVGTEKDAEQFDDLTMFCKNMTATEEAYHE